MEIVVSKSHSSPVEGSSEPLLYVWLWHRGGQNLTETPLSKMLNRYYNILYILQRGMIFDISVHCQNVLLFFVLLLSCL